MKYGLEKMLQLIPMIMLITIVGVGLTNLANERLDAEKSIALNNAEMVTENSIEIHNEEEYLQFAQSVNDGNHYEDYQVILCSDLDFSGYEDVLEIGVEGRRSRNFMGTFEGNGHKISGIKMSRPGGAAGVFVNLRGTVKNLRVEECVFNGKTCGAIASDTTGATILNCYVNAKCNGKIAGEIVGILDGNMNNCVAAGNIFAAEVKNGTVLNCYAIEQANISEMNKNLYHLSGYYNDVSFCKWGMPEEGALNTDKENLVESITGRMKVRGEEILVNAYYSISMKKWCVALPAKYDNAEISFELKTTNGEIQKFSRKAEEDEIYFEWNQESYPLIFLCADNVDTIYITLDEHKSLKNIHADKEVRASGRMMILSAEGEISYVPIKEFYGHGNDSWKASKKSYNIKLNAHMDLFNMGANDDFVFLAGYRDDSLMSYVTTTELVQELGVSYAPEFHLVNLYVSGEYVGAYFLTEKIELDTNRIDISSVYKKTKDLNGTEIEQSVYCEWKDDDTLAERYYYDVKINPTDITGGYLLEADLEDYAMDDSRFVSERGLPFTLKRAQYTSKEQVEYIADFWQHFEDALFAENGYNDLGRHYSEYIDMESFAMQWLIYELEEESSLNSSIYFYKESDITGDGLLHACYPWDIEHSYVRGRDLNLFWIDWTDEFKGYWKGLYTHKDFKNEVFKVWHAKFVPAIEKMIADEPMEYDSGLRNLGWYKRSISELSMLENSRWGAVNPRKRCDEIKLFLEKRLEVISEKLSETQ